MMTSKWEYKTKKSFHFQIDEDYICFMLLQFIFKTLKKIKNLL